jgi:Glyoxalase-like domain
VVVDCHEPARLAEFYAQLLGYEVEAPPIGFSSWEEFLRTSGVPEQEWGSASAVVDSAGVGPRLFFQRVPEPKQVKNRLHLDVDVTGGRGVSPEDRETRLADAVRRAIDLGARQLSEHRDGGRWVTMVDPEDNEFCLH